ncbi:MAG: tRNA threonylcarbamoyladenosine dehydratase [Gudongella sp.]|nr:tRNA threonylcarbamoyladenosine dehydratase [Gudongella sp.]
MTNWLNRSKLLLGEDAIKKLQTSCVAIFGIGGVGSYTAESLARCGIGKIVLIDYDIIDVTNINRQIHATSKTIGMYKVEAMQNRLTEINPNIKIVPINLKYSCHTREEFCFEDYDYIIDAVDMISAKIDLVKNAEIMGIPIISSMGAGNKLNPTDFIVSDIYKTKVCPLARVMRHELRKIGIAELKVVYSQEEPIKTSLMDSSNRKLIPGSVSFVPSVVGLIIASEVVKDLIK